MRAFGRDHSHRGDELRLSRLQGPRRTRLRDQRAEVAPGLVRELDGPLGWGSDLPLAPLFTLVHGNGPPRTSRLRSSKKFGLCNNLWEMHWPGTIDTRAPSGGQTPPQRTRG